MDLLYSIFGEGKNLNALQMSCRGIVVFFIALVLIRISGRRSFGVKTALDTIIAISLGSILSRAVVGVSPFVPVITACFIIVLFHRIFAWILITHPKLSHIIQGSKILLFENGHFIEENMKKGLVHKEEIMQGVRTTALTEDLSLIDKIYIERNGVIVALKKNT